MANRIPLSDSGYKSYKTEQNAENAMSKYPDCVRYIIVPDGDRYRVVVVEGCGYIFAVARDGHFVVG